MKKNEVKLNDVKLINDINQIKIIFNKEADEKVNCMDLFQKKK